MVSEVAANGLGYRTARQMEVGDRGGADWLRIRGWEPRWWWAFGRGKWQGVCQRVGVKDWREGC